MASPLSLEETRDIDANLRPKHWDEYLGQEKIKGNLQIIIEAAKKRGDALEHLLFHGNSGLGKTTLASVVAQEMGVGIKTCTGPSLEKAGDVASLLTNLNDGEILFIDECHRLHRTTMEILYSAMEDFTLHLVLGKGPMARTVDLSLPRFTLIGATTRMALLPAPLRNRFGAIFQFSFYNQAEMERIVERSATLLGTTIEPRARSIIAARSRYTPRIANRLLKRVRDMATISGETMITETMAREMLASLEVDSYGLEINDRLLLETIITKFAGGPVGIQALAATVSEEQDTILDVYEPYLLQLGFLERTPKGTYCNLSGIQASWYCKKRNSFVKHIVCPDTLTLPQLNIKKEPLTQNEVKSSQSSRKRSLLRLVKEAER